MQTLQRLRWTCALVFLVLVGLAAGPANASIDYGDRNGVTMDFLGINETTTTAGDPDALFGAPTIVGDRLLFFPTQYSSYSAGVSADTTSGTLQMTVQAKDGYFLETIRISEIGDYTLTGTGDAQAHISGLLTVTALSGFISGVTLEDFQSELFTITPGSGPFSLNWEIDLSGQFVDLAMFSFNNNLQTSSTDGTTAFIQKKVVNGPAVGVTINQTPVPLPPALLLLGSGLIGIRCLRRRKSL